MNSGALRTTVAVLAVVLTLGAFGWYLVSSGDTDDRASDEPAGTPTPVETLSVEPSRDVPAPRSEPTTEPTVEVTACDDESTLGDPEGTGETLLPDCGEPPVTHQQQRRQGLSLGCGGKFPVILYKSTTAGGKVSVCGRNAVGDDFRVVIKPDGADLLDLPGDYDWRQDAYVADHDGTTYEIHAVDGSLHVTRGGATQVHESSDWMSLENETDDL